MPNSGAFNLGFEEVCETLLDVNECMNDYLAGTALVGSLQSWLSYVERCKSKKYTFVCIIGVVNAQVHGPRWAWHRVTSFLPIELGPHWQTLANARYTTKNLTRYVPQVYQRASAVLESVVSDNLTQPYATLWRGETITRISQSLPLELIENYST